MPPEFEVQQSPGTKEASVNACWMSLQLATNVRSRDQAQDALCTLPGGPESWP